jgi:signal transduction histidine kinase
MKTFFLKDPKMVSVIGVVALIGYSVDVLFYPLTGELLLLNYSSIGLTFATLIYNILAKPKIEIPLSLYALILLANLAIAPFLKLTDPDFSSFYLRNSLIFWVIMPLLGLTIHKKVFLGTALFYISHFFVILYVGRDDFLMSSAATITMMLIGYIYVILYLLRTLEESSKKAENLIDDLREKNHELILRKEELRSLVKTKDKLFSIIAHDIKSPFMGITGLSAMLKDSAKKGDTENLIEYSELIHDTTFKTNELFTNLMDWSSSQTGELKIIPEHRILDEYIDEAMELLKEQKQKKEISLKRENTNVSIYADVNSLSTIIRNLISNALKFTPQNGEVKISLNRTDGENIISVTDNGVGISEKALSQLFKDDTFVSTMGTNREKGTGIGLSLCKHLVERNNGSIWVESEPNKGTTFSFSLPISNEVLNQ